MVNRLGRGFHSDWFNSILLVIFCVHESNERFEGFSPRSEFAFISACGISRKWLLYLSIQWLTAKLDPDFFNILKIFFFTHPVLTASFEAN